MARDANLHTDHAHLSSRSQLIRHELVRNESNHASRNRTCKLPSKSTVQPGQGISVGFGDQFLSRGDDAMLRLCRCLDSRLDEIERVSHAPRDGRGDTAGDQWDRDLIGRRLLPCFGEGGLGIFIGGEPDSMRNTIPPQGRGQPPPRRGIPKAPDQFQTRRLGRLPDDLLMHLDQFDGTHEEALHDATDAPAHEDAREHVVAAFRILLADAVPAHQQRILERHGTDHGRRTTPQGPHAVGAHEGLGLCHCRDAGLVPREGCIDWLAREDADGAAAPARDEIDGRFGDLCHRWKRRDGVYSVVIGLYSYDYNM
mmetsp:Transcript_2861/g.7916  ORF Transcript_2861/g.7916 Transcript_2861/m.7916 type:complete len:312 (+) Transcript_2861:188-1123(+)